MSQKQIYLQSFASLLKMSEKTGDSDLVQLEKDFQVNYCRKRSEFYLKITGGDQ